MPFNITKFKSNLKFGGARPYLFQVQLSLPQDVQISGSLRASFSEKFSFSCRSASIPGSSVSNIEIPYQGRKVYCAGNRVFEPWTVTIINDEDYSIRSVFEFWLGSINGHSSNTKNSGVTSSPRTYQSDAVVKQYSQDSEIPIKTYIFAHLFPTEMSQIELDWNSTDIIEEFSVTFRYDYWRIGPND